MSAKSPSSKTQKGKDNGTPWNKGRSSSIDNKIEVLKASFDEKFDQKLELLKSSFESKLVEQLKSRDNKLHNRFTRHDESFDNSEKEFDSVLAAINSN